MTRNEAVAKLKRLLGAKLHWQEDKRPSSQELRDAASVEVARIKELHEASKAELDAKHRELLSDPTYQAMGAKTKALREELDRARWAACHYRIDVGTRDSIFFMVKAHGDNWADVVRKVEAMQKARAS